MTLKKTLQQIKASSRSKMPAESVAIMGRAIDQLKNSGMVDLALGPGQPSPDSILPTGAASCMPPARYWPEGP